MTNRLQQLGIEHVVVLTLENRGFDHVMGWLYNNEENIDIPTNIIQKGGSEKQPFIGLSKGSSQQTQSFLQQLANPSFKNNNTHFFPVKGARSPKTPAFNPGEHFVHIMGQMYGSPQSKINWGNPEARATEIAKYTQAPMNGYVRDYAETVEHEANVTVTSEIASEILDTYVPEQLPVLSGLARHFAVSDYWFCSVPSQTNTNRAFATAGTARGLVTNNFYDAHKNTWNPGIKVALGSGSHADRLPGYPNNLFTLLSDFGVSWKVYWQEPWPPSDIAIGFEHQYVRTMFAELNESRFDDHFVKYDPADEHNPLFEHARKGQLPAVSWIEPKWGGGAAWDSFKRQVGNDMHPVCDTLIAEDFVLKLYHALSLNADGSENAKWEKTVFIITFDENGGTYDHIPPPAAPPTARDMAPHPHQHADIDNRTRTQFGYQFDSFGIRIPTIIASPFVEAKTVFRNMDTPYDHTSVIATILDWQGINRKSWLLGERVALAPTFEHIFTREQARNNDTRIAKSLPVTHSSNETLKFGDKVILQYIGNRWSPDAHRYNGDHGHYLTQAESSLRTYYPTLGAHKEDAVKFTLLASDHRQVGAPLLNMTELRLESTESNLNTNNILGAFHDSHYLYYYREEKKDSEEYDVQRWQIRTLGSRDDQNQIFSGDEVFFVSKLKPTGMQSLSSRITPDQSQRMTASPKDDTYLSTQAGEWGLWLIHKAP